MMSRGVMHLISRLGTVSTAACLLLMSPLGALAQTATGTQNSSGPMVVERIHSGVLIAPDFKITDFDGKATGLAGAYGGWLADETFLLGAGAYWLTDDSPNRDMWYAGLVT